MSRTTDSCRGGPDAVKGAKAPVVGLAVELGEQGQRRAEVILSRLTPAQAAAVCDVIDGDRDWAVMDPRHALLAVAETKLRFIASEPTNRRNDGQA